VNVLLFLVSLAATLVAAGIFVRRLDRLAVRHGLPEAAVGILTAIAADAPELASAATAMIRGEHDVGIGVILGSNMFNLAAMIGLVAVVAAPLRIDRPTLLIEGAAGLAVLGIVIATIAGGLNPWIAVVLLGIVLAVYVRSLENDPAVHGREPAADRGWLAAELVRELPAVAVIVLGAIGMVSSSVALAEDRGWSKALVGLLILAVVTSLPNAYTALRLGRQRRGAAVVSDAFNSNTINLAGGIIIPALVGTVDRGPVATQSLIWVVGITLLCIAALARPNGAGRIAGAAIIVVYVAFVCVRLAA
jgi:cation:H+ antiporter